MELSFRNDSQCKLQTIKEFNPQLIFFNSERAKLKQRVKQLSASPLSTSERLSIQDQRRRLLARVKTFHNTGDRLFQDANNAELHDQADDTPQSDSNFVNASDESDEEGLTDDEDGDVHSENMRLRMPSSIPSEERRRLQIQVITDAEIQLRMGQANESLAKLRLAIGNKSLLLRGQVRKADGQKQRTRAWDDVSSTEAKIKLHQQSYNSARQALVALDAPEDIMDKYQFLSDDDLQVNADITEENRFGQRNHELPWIWRVHGQNLNNNDDWMEEC